MGTRLELQQLLETLLGSRNVYFQPPETIKMKFPCFVYYLHGIDTNKAGDTLYIKTNHYRVQYISKDADNTMADELLKLQYCSFIGRSVIDNLYHDNFDLYY